MGQVYFAVPGSAMPVDRAALRDAWIFSVALLVTPYPRFSQFGRKNSQHGHILLRFSLCDGADSGREAGIRNASELCRLPPYSEAYPNTSIGQRASALDKVYRGRLLLPRESLSMATITTLKTTPHTRIENSIIVNMADIGVYAYAVYCAIKMHLNQTTGACFPSYATIARMTGIHRSTVIDCVKTLTARKLISPLWRYKEDGSHASNQYDFQQACGSAPSKKNEEVVKNEQGGRPERPPVVAPNDHPSRPERPEQSSSLNKKIRTIAEVDFYPTEKQKTCPHPSTEIVHLSDNVTLCHHCYGLLDENLKLREEDKPAKRVCAA